MAQLAGTRLGSYDVLSLVGAGGMGEVYRARDTRLGREVALKILPTRFALDPHRVSRFKREAHVLASLNHTNIAILYDIEEADGIQALVMELVEGDTLADRIVRAPLPVRDVIAIATQLVDGLEAAHERGVIHRDLKPSNIALRSDGALKILDFGLATALDAAPPADSSAPTVAATMTEFGAVIGTPAYMSPEQAQGRAADMRSDIWAFGCVLFEMLTRKRAFEAETRSATIAAVMTREPDWNALPPDVPSALRTLLGRCLEKDRKHRLAHIADARPEIVEAAAPSRARSALETRPARRREMLAWCVAAVSVTALVAGVMYVTTTRRTPAEVRFTLSVPESVGLDPRIALSPDGRSLVYVAPGAARIDLLWVRRLDELEGKPLGGTEGASSPFWSPDSRSIGFFAQGKLKRIPVNGGTVQTLVEGLRPQIGGTGGTWNSNDLIVFAQVFGPLQAVSAQGGEVRRVTELLEVEKEFGHYDPFFLADGEHLVYDVGASPERSGVYVSSLTSTVKTRVLPRRVTPFVVTSDGVMLYMDSGLLKAQRFDLQRLQLEGSSIPITDSALAISVSTNGILAYRTAIAARRQLTWFDRRGTRLGTLGSPGRYESVALSPDDTRVAVARDADIWMLDPVRGDEIRVTSDPGWDGFPVWSADGNEILYARGAIGDAMGGTLLREPASGAGAEEVLFEQRILFPMESSGDGRFLTYVAPGQTNSLDLFLLDLSNRKPILYLDSRFQERGHRLSPDGKWMLYQSDETGRQEVYVQTVPRSEKRWKISSDGGMHPMWRRDGRELFFLRPDGALMAADVATAPAFSPAVPRVLFQTDLGGEDRLRFGYAPTRDGQRFLLNSPIEKPASAIVVVLNWSGASGVR
jgi:eukaryotic-like serine/threonine-protein kinase